MIYSHSRLESFEKCRLKFKYRYIDKIIPDIGKSIEAHLGSVVHAVLEWLYLEIKNNNKTQPIEQVITYYADQWKKDFTPDIIIVKKEFSEKDYFNKGVDFLVKYYTKHYPFKEKTIAVEHKIDLQLNEDIRIIGYIDRLVENLETHEIEIHDYKTANSMPRREQIESNRQLALYSLAIQETFGKDKPICLVWHYLAHDLKVCIRKTEEQLETLKKEIIELVHEIETATEFPPNKSILCNWCEYKEICPEFNEVPKNNERQSTLGNL
jgi:putative RecB family exonuclease